MACSSYKNNPDEVQSREVTIVTEDKVTLKGTYYSVDKPGPGILLLHMCVDGTDRRVWNNLATKLVAEGFHVLTFDYRGYGQSEGAWPKFQGITQFMEVCRTVIMKDVEAAYQFLRAQKGVLQDRLGLAGASCGIFLGVETSRLHSEIRALALLSGPLDEQARQYVEVMQAVPIFCAASQDDVRAFEAMKLVFAASKHSNSAFIQYKGDAHGTFMFAKEPDLERTLVEWFKRWL
ncbi:MAG: alpha/beta hydrolase family protein [bacterium]